MSWVGRDPAQSKIAVDRIVATTSIVVWAQLLTALTTGPKQEISHRLLMVISSAQAT